MDKRFKISDRRYQNGFTYIGLLIAVVFFGLGSVGAARILASSERGERERELLYVGNDFRQAIASYYRSSPGAPKYPETLEALVLDPRFPTTKRHLRKIHADPISTKIEWGLIPAPEGGIMGVHSLSGLEPLKRANFDFANKTIEAAIKSVSDRPYSYRDWQFVYREANRVSAPVAEISRSVP